MAACPHANDQRHACRGQVCGHCPTCARPIDDHYDIATKQPHCPKV